MYNQLCDCTFVKESMVLKREDKSALDNYLERRELIQDVIDRLLSNPEYKAKLKELNEKYPALKDYNRNLDKSREN